MFNTNTFILSNKLINENKSNVRLELQIFKTFYQSKVIVILIWNTQKRPQIVLQYIIRHINNETL